MPKEYRTIQEVAGPLMLVRGVENVTYDELGEIELANGETRRCKVLEIDGGNAWYSCLKTLRESTCLTARCVSWGEPWSWAYRRICWDACSTVWAAPLTEDRRFCRRREEISTAFP